MKKKEHVMRQRHWIKQYLKEHHGTCVTDALFHEQFYNKFRGKRKETLWGAQPVWKAMKLLKQMYEEGELTRDIVGLGANWQPGFPKWNYVYC